MRLLYLLRLLISVLYRELYCYSGDSLGYKLYTGQSTLWENPLPLLIRSYEILQY